MPVMPPRPWWTVSRPQSKPALSSVKIGWFQKACPTLKCRRYCKLDSTGTRSHIPATDQWSARMLTVPAAVTALANATHAGAVPNGEAKASKVLQSCQPRYAIRQPRDPSIKSEQPCRSCEAPQLWVAGWRAQAVSHRCRPCAVLRNLPWIGCS